MKKHKETKTACISFKSIIFVKKLILPLRLCIKQGIPEPGTESGEHAEYGECYIPGMFLNIPGNVAKYSGECHQTFRAILPIFGVKEDNYLAESHLHPVKHPQWSSSVKISDGLNTTKKLHRRCLTGFQMRL